MAISPRSTVSSDLYSPSEPEHLKPQLNGNTFEAEDFVPVYDDSNDGKEGSIFSDIMEGMEVDSEDSLAPSSTGRSSTARISSGTSLKRKRDDHIETRNDPKNMRAQRTLDDISTPPIRDTSGSIRGPSLGEDDDIVDGPSKPKRSKPIGELVLSPGGLESTPKPSTLPAALWQHVFCFVPPVFLGRLLRVNRTFNSYLTSAKALNSSEPPASGVLQPQDGEAVWVASRRRFAPGLPRPIHGMGELDTWRLLIGRNCQVCGVVNDTGDAALSENPWEAGPGKSGNHYIGHSLLKDHVLPAGLEITKHFYKPGIEDTIGRFEEAKALGPASAEEWMKGLATQGQERLEDIIRWEHWESRGGLKKIKSRHPKLASSGAMLVSKKNVPNKDESHSDRSTPQSIVSSMKQKLDHQSAPANSDSKTGHSALPNPIAIPPQSAWGLGNHYPSITHQPLPAPAHQQRPERNIRDVNEAKAARRAEIERRCALLDPPLTPNLLFHMESFQAAIQITHPMTDQAWQILKPRLVAQLPLAEQKEKERVQQDELIAEKYRQRRSQEVHLKETKEQFDREWETFQNPVRNRLGALADEIIRSRWAGGRSVTKDTSPKFAADVLLQVRQQFYDEIAHEDEVAIAAGEAIKTDPPNGPPTRTLILENMKWLFDTKVKPLTDHFQRELFLCNGCDGNFKFYGFEGVIQHYAAKHTTTLSMGNIVVHWRAEWPEHSPFNPNPSVARTAFYKVPTPANSSQSLYTHDPSVSNTHGGHHEASSVDSKTYSQGQSSYHQPTDPSTAVYSTHHREDYPGTIPGHSYGPQSLYNEPRGYTVAANEHFSNGTNYNPASAQHANQMPPQYELFYPGNQPYSATGQDQPTPSSQSYFPGPNGNTYGSGPPLPYTSNFQNGLPATNGQKISGPVSDLYQRQMDEMAKHAKDVFISIGGVKDLPGSVRIFVVIQLTVSRFKLTFPNEPSLAMFIDGLDHNATMRPVRSVNGLGCKTCIQSGTGAKLFTLPHLVNHFRTVHVENPQVRGYPQAPDLDWKTDMIDLPDASIISKLVNAAGMTESKLALIASVFQGYFPNPLPNLRGKTNTGPFPAFRGDLDTVSRDSAGTLNRATNGTSPGWGGSSIDKFYEQPYSPSRPMYQDAASEPPEPAGDDEYDPHRPALLTQLAKTGPRPSESDRIPIPHSVLESLQLSRQAQSKSTGHNFSSRPVVKSAYDHHDQTLNQSMQLHQATEDRTSPNLSQPDLPLPRLLGHFSVREEEQTDPQREKPIKITRDEGPLEQNNENVGVSEKSVMDQKIHSFDRIEGSVLPPETAHAADQFLSSLMPRSDSSYPAALRSVDQKTEQRRDSQWRGTSEALHRQQGYGDDAIYNHRPLDRAGNGGQVDDVAIHQAVPIGAQRDASQKHHASYRQSPSTQIPPTAGKDDQVSTASHYQQNGIYDRDGANGSTSRRPFSRSQAYGAKRSQAYRARSNSPREVPIDMALYQPRSPIEEDRGDALYRATSPLTFQPQDGRPKVVQYGVPERAGYEYVDERGFRETQYQPRVEYVRIPIEYEDSRIRELPPRYVVSRPVEQAEPQYFRYEQSYGGERFEQLYERGGQLFHAPQRTFYEQPTRGASTFPHDYQY
ncbi:hypothetical protein ACLMJK_002638 [Lecanora helva]